MIDRLTNYGRVLVNQVHRFWVIDIDPFVLGLYRIVLGLYLLLHMAMLLPHWQRYYGPKGISPHLRLPWQDYSFPEPILLYVGTEAGTWVFFLLTIGASLWLISGIRSWAARLWLWVAMHSLLRSSEVANGEEHVLIVLLFFALFLPMDASLRLGRGGFGQGSGLTESPKVEVWGLKVLQVHIMAIYLLGAW